MAAKEIDLTGIDNVNEYYTNHYLNTLFADNIKTQIKDWKETAKEAEHKTPWSKLRETSRLYYRAHERFQRERLDAEIFEQIASLAGKYLEALGYDAIHTEKVELDEETTVPVALEVKKNDGRPRLWVMLSASDDFSAGIIEGHVFDADETDMASMSLRNLPDNETLANKILYDQTEPPRWLIFIGMNQIALLDRHKWNEKRCLTFDLEQIFGRNDESTWQAMAVLLHHDSICPDDGKCLLDELNEESQKNTAGVSEDLKYALRESIELLGNEVLYDLAHNKGRDLEEQPVDAGELTLQCLRYMYRMLFVLFMESRPDLGYAPMKNPVYVKSYSIESLRQTAEQMSIQPDEKVLEGTYIGDSLKTLFDMIYEGYPKKEEEQQKFSKCTSLKDTFVLPPLKAHIFDPERTKMVHEAKLRNRVMLRIIELMSMTREDSKKKVRRGRISYANLGINQLGAAYEALLSYRGFIAETDLYEVKIAKDDFDELKVGYFVTEEELAQYTEEERVRYDKGPNKGKLRHYEKGTFIYRLAGREREKSASYYTPEVLTKCLVKYALKELLKDKTADDILQITVCEPAMGSAAFLNEAINQLAEAYLTKRQQELHDSISYDKRAKELQKVKMYIADRNVYGVDLNPTAVELAEVSLWLNTIYEGGFVPWFGTQLVNGNSLIGARRECYDVQDLQTTVKNLRWYENAPVRIKPQEKRKQKKQIYHFLTGDPGMANYDKDKVIKGLVPDKIKTIKKWNKEFIKPYSDDEIASMLALSKKIDELWQQQVELRKEIDAQTTDSLSIYGHKDDILDSHTTIRRKDELYRKYYKSEHMKNAGPYARLRFAMDYWCALWFWPIDKADLLPTRGEFLADMSFIIEGTASTSETNDILVEQSLFSHDEQLNLFSSEREEAQDAMAEKIRAHYPHGGRVDLDQLCNIFPRFALIKQIAKKNRFMHWELEFADVFHDNGGMSLEIGNPPWIKLTWQEKNILQDKDPIFAIKRLTATETAEKRKYALENKKFYRMYFSEFESVAGQQNFMDANSNYIELNKQQTNFFKCFIVKSFKTINKEGIIGFIHLDGIYFDPSGSEFRENIYKKLVYHFQFQNELLLFKDVGHRRTYSLNIYANKNSNGFISISNLFHPLTIDESFEDKSIDVDGIKDDNGKWNINGNKSRLINVNDNVLKLFNTLYDENENYKGATLPVIHVKKLLDILKKISEYPYKIKNLNNNIFASVMLDETGAQKDKIIYRNEHFPDDLIRMIYTGPNIGVGNPLYQCAKRKCIQKSDFDTIDLTEIDNLYIQRCKYDIKCSINDYEKLSPRTPWESNYINEYKIMCRRRLNQSGERTLISAIAPKKTSHVHPVLGIVVKNQKKLAVLAGELESILFDFFIKTTGKSDLFLNTILKLPFVEEKYHDDIIMRVLLLNCLTKNYNELWRNCYNDKYKLLHWAKNDKRLTDKLFSDSSVIWNDTICLKNDYERREALVEIDVLVCMAIGLTLKQLITIYKSEFPVLKDYEENTWYDANGRIVYSINKALSGKDSKKRKIVGVNTEEWKVIYNLKAGETYIHNFTDDTQPYGAHERKIEYIAPFDRCDREKDYETVWAFFEKKYGSEKEQ